MEIKCRQRGNYLFELTVEDGNTVITADLTECKGTSRQWSINGELMEQFEDALFEMAEFNGLDKKKFLMDLMRRRLGEYEIEQAIEELMENKEGS